MSEHETPGQRARRLLKGTTPGPWRCDRYDVVPMRARSEGWLIADCGTSDSPDEADANAALIAAAPDLAHALIAAEEAHEVTRSAMAAAVKERDDARSILDHVGIALHHRGEPHANLPDVAMRTHRDGELSRRIGALVPRMRRLAVERDAARERVAALEAVIERVRPIVELLAQACDAVDADGNGPPMDANGLMLDLGRFGTSFSDDAAWLRSLLLAARS